MEEYVVDLQERWWGLQWVKIHKLFNIFGGRSDAVADPGFPGEGRGGEGVGAVVKLLLVIHLFWLHVDLVRKW